MRKPSQHLSIDEARLLPRMRWQRQELLVSQAAALDEADPDGKVVLKHKLTKPGDPLALRGIPAVGRSVAGEIRNTNPEKEWYRSALQSARVEERISGEAA